MSNSHECQGHRMISPRRPYSYSPGVVDCTNPVSRPLLRLPPLCGQRSLSAKNSPPRLNTTTARPLTVTHLRPPGGMSSTAAITCLGMCVANSEWRIGRVVSSVVNGVFASGGYRRGAHLVPLSCRHALLTIRHSLCKPIQRASVAGKDGVAALGGQARRQRQERVVEIPVRVVAGE